MKEAAREARLNTCMYGQGRNFAFYHPLGDFNFGGGKDISTYYEMFCTWFRQSTWIMAEQVLHALMP